MKIKVSHTKKVDIPDLKAGQAFRWGGAVCIKTDEKDGENYIIVALGSGEILRLDPTQEVEPLPGAEVTV